MNNLKYFGVCIDEDGCVNIDDVLVKDFKWKGYVNENCGSVVKWSNENCERMEDIKGEIDVVMDRMLNGGVNKEWFNEDEDGKEEKEKLLKGFENIKELLFSCGGVLVGWGIEYDDNLGVLVVDNDEEVVYNDKVDEIEEWFKREVDDSEFEFDVAE